MTGYAVDGHDFIPMAVEKGAVCVLLACAGNGYSLVRVASARRELAVLSAKLVFSSLLMK